MSMPESILRAKAIDLLGDQNLDQLTVASILGVTPGRISQFMSESEFAQAVLEKKIVVLQEATRRDRAYDALEDKVLAKLKTSLETTLIHKPRELAQVLATLNNAKRRGTGVSETPKGTVNLATISLPTNIALQFTVNVNNQIIQVSDGQKETALVTLQTQNMAALAKSQLVPQGMPENKELLELKEISHESSNSNSTSNPSNSSNERKVTSAIPDKKQKDEGLGKLRNFLTGRGLRRPANYDSLDL